MRNLITLALAASTLALTACGGEAEPTEAAAPTYSAGKYNAAVNDIGRPAEDAERDAVRKPGELLAFAHIDKGEVVGDYMMGSGYVTRLLAIAVGPSGKVYGFTPTEFIDFRPAYAEEQDLVMQNYDNVLPVRSSVSAPDFPEPLDTLITVMNFHDLYIDAMPEGTADTAIKALYDALKPGGTLVVIDHSAADGTGTDTTDALHRIGKQFTIDTLTAAGFVLDEESDLYAAPDDPRDANVFDESIRGKTDQFALRFSKPA